MNDEQLKTVVEEFGLCRPQPPHARILEMLGDVDGIDLRTDGNFIVVELRVMGQRIEVIRDCGETIDHSITRSGIAELLHFPRR